MEWNVKDYNLNASHVSKYGQEVVELLSPQEGETILDLGCGDGELAEKILSYGCSVKGIDASEAMVHAAQERGVDALVCSADNMSYQDQFDAVFSNAALHWMKNADVVLGNVYRSLKAGGRFCAEFGGENNVNIIVSKIYEELAKRNLEGDLYNPWYFPSKEEYRLKLEQAGFVVQHIEIFDRRTPLPTDVSGWLKTFAKPFLQDIPQREQESFLQKIITAVEGQLKDDQGKWFADYVRIRFVAKKEIKEG